MQQSELIDRLQHLSQQLMVEAKKIQQLPEEKLPQKPHEKAWNILEIFEHINIYIRKYNGFFEEALRKAKPIVNDPEIKRGYWSNKFINWMDPKVDSMQKMNTFASTNPLGQSIPVKVIEEFITLSERLINHLESAKGKDIQNVKSRLAIPGFKTQAL
ncbi:MAG: hypothetical protein CMO34_03650 [Verrucomicrobia bacterium]|nr:hypothetical protein [Verrucomicrobiota bacterium]|tara:strand:+ start:999 stop:1472 length:474 start_codon:yes stop_codon:yes gene_type:complete